MKPRFGANVDRNQPAIVDALLKAGAKVTVLDLAPTEQLKGEPDLLVGFIGTLTLLETKSRTGRLSEDQKRKHAEWARVGIRVHTVRCIPEALRACGIGPEAFRARAAALGSLADALMAARTRTVGTAKLRPSVRRPA